MGRFAAGPFFAGNMGVVANMVDDKLLLVAFHTVVDDTFQPVELWR